MLNIFQRLIRSPRIGSMLLAAQGTYAELRDNIGAARNPDGDAWFWITLPGPRSMKVQLNWWTSCSEWNVQLQRRIGWVSLGHLELTWRKNSSPRAADVVVVEAGFEQADDRIQSQIGGKEGPLD